MSWGVSKIGRVAQFIDTEKGTLTSEFDTNIFSMTVVPILGWGKLLPTFGGCVETISDVSMKDDDNGLIELEVDYTTARYTHTYTPICTHTCILIHTYIHTYIPSYIHAYINTYKHTHTCIHTYLHTNTHQYIHT